MQVSDGFSFWAFLQETAVPALYSQTYYNGEPALRYDRRFMEDGVGYRVGSTRLRQNRIPPGQDTANLVIW